MISGKTLTIRVAITLDAILASTLVKEEYFFNPKSGRKCSDINFDNFATTTTSQNDHLTAGAWVVCGRGFQGMLLFFASLY